MVRRLAHDTIFFLVFFFFFLIETRYIAWSLALWHRGDPKAMQFFLSLYGNYFGLSR